MRFKVFIVSVFFVWNLLSGISLAQNKVVVIPLIDNKPTCMGKLVGTRWCKNGNATVTDMSTGLVWLEYADWGGQIVWRKISEDYIDAHQKASSLHQGLLVHSEGGQHIFLTDGSVEGDWRLPTITELHILANGTEAVRSDNMRAFTGVQPDYYWSSSTHDTDSRLAYCVLMNNGTTCNGRKGWEEYYVWPVRGPN